MTKKSTSKKKTSKKTANKGRREARSISEMKDQMTTDQRKGYVRRWVNDTEGRVALFLGAGWDLVREDVAVGDEGVVNQNQSLGSGARKHVGSDKMGHPMYAVLMEIPKRDYDAISKRKAEQVDETEAVIRARLKEQHKYGEFSEKVTK